MNPMNHALNLNLDAEVFLSTFLKLWIYVEKYINFGFGSPLAEHVDSECFVVQKFGFAPFGYFLKKMKWM